MRIDDKYNYCILSNNINKTLLDKFAGYPIIDASVKYDELKQKLEFFNSKTVIFNETLYNLRKFEKRSIFELLKKQNIKYINITSNIEEAIFCDYMIVFDNDNIILEGLRNDILKEEKTLKRIGYGLPFIVDLSTQLKAYGVINEEFYDIDSLAGELWN